MKSAKELLSPFNETKLGVAKLLLPMCPFMEVDVRIPGVVLPQALMRPELILRIGENPNVMGMPDLTLDDKGWRATVVAGGVRHYIEVPWEAIHRMWVNDPFVGPACFWPQLTGVEVVEKKESNEKPVGLRLVKDDG